MSDRVFSKHAAERWFERYPNTDFKIAVSSCERVRSKRTNHKRALRKHAKSGAKVYRSLLGPTFIVIKNIVVTVI